MQMLGVLSAVFFAALILMCWHREKLNHPIFPPLFWFVCVAFFFCWNYAAFERGWLDDGFMTLENISPYVCTVILVTPLLHERVRELADCAIAFLAFGMFLAMYISPGAEYFFNFVQTATFMHVAEQACHLGMALYGFFLILSGRVKLDFKSYFKALAFVYASICFGVFLNWCFHLSNFGMDMYGNYSIYFLDIFGSFEATLVAYLIGVLVVITLGLLVGMFLDWISRPKAVAENAPLIESINDTAESKINENTAEEAPSDE